MNKAITRFLPAAVLVLGCGFTWKTHLQERVLLAAPLDSLIPALPIMPSRKFVITAEEHRVAGMDDYVERLYRRRDTDSTDAFSTFVSYYDRQSQGRTIHSPKNCLPASGWEVMTVGTVSLTAAGSQWEVNHEIIKNGPASAIVYYWYQGRGRVVASEYQVKLNLLEDAAFKGHTEESLVRVVVPIPFNPNPEDAAASSRIVSQADSLGTSVSEQLLVQVQKALATGHG